MNKGRALRGHRRMLAPVGAAPSVKRSPPGGWEVSCICGWAGGNAPNTAAGQALYKAHIDFQIDHCLFKCKRCGEEKPVSAMRPDNRYVCRSCFSQLGNEWQKGHPDQAARHK